MGAGAAPDAWVLVNPMGQAVLAGSLEPGQSRWETDLGDLPAGMYFLELAGPEGRVVLRVMKE